MTHRRRARDDGRARDDDRQSGDDDDGPSPAAGREAAGRGHLPSLSGAVEWLNSPPLTAEGLKGKVVLVDFWTYSCINCLRAIPYVRAWAEKYKDQGLVVIGVHAPEFAFEKNVANVRRAVADLQITYPVAIDNDYAIWRAFDNQYWPAHYFIDAKGRIRHHHFGEGDYDDSERVIQQLLAEAGKSNVSAGWSSVDAVGRRGRRPTCGDVQSPETYLGYRPGRELRLAGRRGQRRAHVYAAGTPRLNEWALSGDWTIGGEHADLNTKDGAHRLPLPCARPASGARTGAGRQADPVPRDDRRRGAGRQPRRRCRCRRRGRRDRTAALPARPAERPDHRPHVRDPSSSIPAFRPTPSPSAETGDRHHVRQSLEAPRAGLRAPRAC